MTQKINKAKDIYIKYIGDKFQMMRDGVSEEYEMYNVSSAKEREWMDEHFENELRKLNINNISSLSSIWFILKNKDDNVSLYLSKVVDFIIRNKNESIDSTHFLIYSQSIVEIIDSYLNNYYSSVDKTLLMQEKQKLINARNEHM